MAFNWTDELREKVIYDEKNGRNVGAGSFGGAHRYHVEQRQRQQAQQPIQQPVVGQTPKMQQRPIGRFTGQINSIGDGFQAGMQNFMNGYQQKQSGNLTPKQQANRNAIAAFFRR